MLHLHRATRADALVAALRETLATPPDDPFAPEVVAVPSRGVERWVAQRLSHDLGAQDGREDGICANVLFPSPARLVEQALAAATGIDPDEDPWAAGRALWPLIEVVDAHAGEAWLGPLHGHIGRSRGRLGAVAHVAALFESYAVHRPELLLAWLDGDDTTIPDDARWQPALWRALRERLGVPSLPERLAPAAERLAAEPDLVDLPQRLAILGLTRLPAARVPVLSALAAHRDVHLHLLHPSPALWDAISAQDPARARTPRSDDPTAGTPRHRLLASWGRDARELQLVLRTATAEATDTLHPVDQPADTLLHAIQAAIAADAPPPEDPERRPLLDPGDASLRVHSCHGRARQVEVLRDAILHLLADDPTLEPRDVIVMCPDIEAFAPLIHATFGSGEVLEDDGDAPVGDDEAPRPEQPDLRVRLADRSLRQTNPVLAVVARLLELADARVTASEVLDLADRDPVRRRFRLDDEDVARVERWVATSGVRWGLSAAHRAPFGLATLPRGTWEFGLDRLLVGVSTAEGAGRLVGGVLPLDDVGSADIDLAGRFAELVDRLAATLEDLVAPKPLAAWAQTLSDAADALTATTPQDAWQRQELAYLLADVLEEAAAGDAAQTTELELADVRGLLADRLRGRPTRANFRTGHLTICTLVPMRAVPHRVVCLLGLDDEVFPRTGVRDGDDLVQRFPHVGDRDARLEDRQLLLDAVMSATDRLVITYGGRDERTNAKRPPAVPVGELLDVVDRTVRAGDPDARPRDQVVVEHPLQPFDPRNFEPGTVAGDGPWAFDRTALDGARALRGERVAAPPFLAEPLPPLVGPVVEVEDLVRFVQRPVRTFLRRRLDVTVGDFDDEIEDGLPVELDALERWGVGERLLQARLRGVAGQDAVTAEFARGFLPPGELGNAEVRRVWPQVDTVLRCAREALDLAVEPGSVDVRTTLPDGRVLSGTVPGVAGDVLRAVTYSTLGPQHRIAAWVRLLALTAARPERAFRAVAVGKHPEGAAVSRIGPLGDDPQARRATALEHLAVLVDLFDRGMREPLPLACRTSHAYAHAATNGFDPPWRFADREWLSGFNFDREDRAPEHLLAFGGQRPIGELLAAPPRPDEAAWHAGETSRLGAYARRLWAGLFAFEQLEQR